MSFVEIQKIETSPFNAPFGHANSSSMSTTCCHQSFRLRRNFLWFFFCFCLLCFGAKIIRRVFFSSLSRLRFAKKLNCQSKLSLAGHFKPWLGLLLPPRIREQRRLSIGTNLTIRKLKSDHSHFRAIQAQPSALGARSRFGDLPLRLVASTPNLSCARLLSRVIISPLLFCMVRSKTQSRMGTNSSSN